MITEKLRCERVWLLINAVGLIIYLSIEHWILAPRPEGYELNGFDIWSLWVTRLLPVLTTIAVLDVIWLVKLLKSLERSTRLCFWLGTILVWGVAVLYSGFTINIAKIVIAIITDKARR